MQVIVSRSVLAVKTLTIALMAILGSLCTPQSALRTVNSSYAHVTRTVIPVPRTPLAPSANQPSGPTPILTQITFPEVERRCHFLGQVRPELSGRLVMTSSYTFWSDFQPQSFILDLKSDDRIPIGQTRHEAVSPDGRWLAYFDDLSNIVAVADFDGNRILEMHSPIPRLDPAYWLNNEILLLNEVFATDPSYDFRYKAAGGLVLLNPFTGELEHWLPGYPDQYVSGCAGWQTASSLIINPQQTHLLYPVYEDNVFGIALHDLRTDQNIAVVTRADHPIWAPDGERFVVNAEFADAYDTELMLVDLIGHMDRLTFSDETGAFFIERNYSWSPTANKIALWRLDFLNSRAPELLVVSTVDKSVINFCEFDQIAEHPYSLGYLIFSPPVVWSPDEKYLSVSVLDEDLNLRVFLLRLEDGQAWPLAEEVSSIGWMLSAP